MWYGIIILVVFFILGVSYQLYCAIKFRENAKILGLRVPNGKYDSFEKKKCEQFCEECLKYNIILNPQDMPNLCKVLYDLGSKGLHLELVKESTIRYKVKDGNYLGSKEWQDKWNKIVFSPHIKGEDFCDCIKVIMSAHYFREADNRKSTNFKGNDGKIKTTDSFFIYRALSIMRYKILIKENESSLIGVNDARMLNKQ